MTKGKAALKPKKRRRRGELYQCYKCPREHPGWKRFELRARKRMPYCPEHLAEYDAKKPKPWPRCPSCRGSEFGIMRWHGEIDNTVSYCEECGYDDLAVNHFDRATIKMIASPIVTPRDGGDK